MSAPHPRTAPACFVLIRRLLLQSAYQVTWMLLILFGAPEVFDRYKIRNKCEAFNAGRAFESGEAPFCEHKDVTSLTSNSGVSITAICQAMFPLGVDGCPDLREPNLEAATTWLLPAGGTCETSAATSCEELLKDGESVRPPRSRECAPFAAGCHGSERMRPPRKWAGVLAWFTLSEEARGVALRGRWARAARTCRHAVTAACAV